MMSILVKKRSVIHRGIDYIGHGLVLLSVVIISLLLQLAAVTLGPFQRYKWVARVLSALFRAIPGGFWFCFKLTRLIQIRSEGEAAPDGPVIFVANHPSFFDALVLLPLLPRSVCLYKSSLERNFLPTSIASAAGFISDSDNLGMIRTGVKRLQEGWCVLLFPEGTRTSTPPMGPWKSAFSMMAIRAQKPVQIVHVQMDPPLFPKNVSWWKPPHYPVRVRVRFGLSISPRVDHTARQFHREVEAAFRHEFIEHQPASARSA